MEEISEAVVSAAVSGDSDAQGEIFRILGPRVVSYLRSRGSSDPEGQTTDTFVQVFKRISTLSGGASGLRSFVFTVAHARLVDDIRSRARGPVFEPYEAEFDERTSLSAETDALDREGVRHLLSHLDNLPDDQKSAITLRILGHLSLEETAVVMGKSVGSIKQLQRRGLIALRQALTES